MLNFLWWNNKIEHLIEMCMYMLSSPDGSRFIEKFSQSVSCIYTRNSNLILYELNSELKSVGSFPTEQIAWLNTLDLISQKTIVFISIIRVYQLWKSYRYHFVILRNVKFIEIFGFLVADSFIYICLVFYTLIFKEPSHFWSLNSNANA